MLTTPMIKALLVDDHGLFRAGMCMLLAALSPGIEVHQASDVPGALTLLQDEPDTDLVLLDLHMPGCKGLSALHDVRAGSDQVRVVVLSGNEDSQLVREAIDSGAMGYIHKSIEPEGMLVALDTVLSGGVYLPPHALHEADSRSDAPTTRERLSAMGITARQSDVLFKAVQGKSNKVIARELSIAESTVKTHLLAVFEIFEVSNRTQLVFEVARRGLTGPDLEA